MPFAQRRELLARPDAAATVDRLTGALNGTERPELHIELIALAVLRARQAAERVGKRIVDGALLGGETKAW